MHKLLVLFAAALLIAGCEGDTGPTGPAGNANVMAGTISPTNAEWICCSNWKMTTDVGTVTAITTRYVDIPVAEITADIIANGAVLMYFEAETGSARWAPLPFELLHYTRAYFINVVYEVQEGMIRLHYFLMSAIPGVTPPDPATVVIPTYHFKYLVIEGTALLTLQAGGIDLSEPDRIIEYATRP
ncbi:MAG: hypothetical protein JSV33_03415 [bacterium]|nr:MAG: hypothetical protein JSV33_03415 [bacterium]